jgi:hypothetical protein
MAFRLAGRRARRGAYGFGSGYSDEPPGGVLITDAFNRADGALGLTDTGETWVHFNDPRAISSNKAVVANSGGIVSGSNGSVIDATISDGIVEAVLAEAMASYGTRVIGRWTDDDNYIFADADPTGTKLWKKVAGVDTELEASATVLALGEALQIEFNDDDILMLIDGVSIADPAVDAFNLTATHFGIGHYDGVGRALDSFRFQSL